MPLIDAEMISQPEWHDALVDLGKRCDRPNTSAILFPVALHSTAVNAPAALARRNMIRYQGPEWKGNEAGKDEVPQLVGEAFDEVIKHLTEAFTRDLSPRIFPNQDGLETQIFISYARADGADVPKALRAYVQSHTQCDAFLDENDIAFGQYFDVELENSLKKRSAALIAVWGDNYPFRPWCRWELDRFASAKLLPLSKKRGNPSTAGGNSRIHYFPPVLALSTKNGDRFSRVLPELASATCIRYRRGCERTVFANLMREVFFGLADTLAARDQRDNLGPGGTLEPRRFFLNRLPSTAYLAEILRPGEGDCHEAEVYHPGIGLAPAERKLLAKQLPNTTFRAYRQATLPKKLDGAKLDCWHAWVSASDGDSFLDYGYLPHQQRELFIRLLRPLVRRGCSILYGGAPPKATLYDDPADPGTRRFNWTRVFLELLSDETSLEKEESGDIRKPSRPLPRLINPSPWPGCDSVTSADIASWMPVASIVRFVPNLNEPPFSVSGTDAESLLKSLVRPKDDDAEAWAKHCAVGAVSLEQMRRKVVGGFDCPVPGESGRKVKPDLLIQIGGKLSDFSGTMPGIFSEFLAAVEAEIPVFLLGGFGGTTGELGKMLCQSAQKRGPKQPTEKTASPIVPSHLLTPDHYRDLPDSAEVAKRLGGKTRYAATVEILGEEKVEAQFEALRAVIGKAATYGLKGILKNGLGEKENEELLTTSDTNRAAELVWTGVGKLAKRRD